MEKFHNICVWARSSISGKGNENLPHNIKVTVKWEDIEVQETRD
jgi:hypothetical protein